MYYCLTVTVLFSWGALSDERTGLSFVYAAGPCQRGLSRVRIPGTIFYCLTFETSLFVTSYDSQDHGGGIRPRFHTGYCTVAPIVDITPRHGPRRKQSLYCWSVFTSPLHSNGRGADHIENTASLLLMRIYRWHVFTGQLLRSGLHNPIVLLFHACMLRALHSNGRRSESLLSNGLIHHNLLPRNMN
jgi:hypothetical protein